VLAATGSALDLVAEHCLQEAAARAVRELRDSVSVDKARYDVASAIAFSTA